METQEPKNTGKFGKGNPGKPKGAVNKSTQIVRDAIANLLERNAPQMDQWLNQVAEEDPYKALDLMNKLCEYHIPKLARHDVQSTVQGNVTINVNTGIDV